MADYVPWSRSGQPSLRCLACFLSRPSGRLAPATHFPAAPGRPARGTFLRRSASHRGQSIVAAQSLQSISNDDSIEDWVRARYQLIFWHSVTGAIYALTNAAWISLSIDPGVVASLMGLVILLSSIITTVLQFLAWVMPERYRKWLNRNQQVHTEERLRERALVILNTLGSAMSDDTGISPMTAVILLRKMIGQEIKTEDALKISERATAMRYPDWQGLLGNHDFHLLIASLTSVSESQKAINNALNTLSERQSLFTMRAK